MIIFIKNEVSKLINIQANKKSNQFYFQSDIDYVSEVK